MSRHLNTLSDRWVIIAFIMLYPHLICGEGWESKFRSNLFELTTKRMSVDITSTTKTVIVDGLLSCANVCTSESSMSLFYKATIRLCYCNSEPIETVEDPLEEEVTYGILVRGTEKLQKGNATQTISLPRRKDCLEWYDAGSKQDGVYQIQPTGGTLIDTWCDMTNGGWTVIQRRVDGTEDFYRGWTDYVKGFGNTTGEYWLGLDNIHLLTTEPTEMNVFLDTFGDVTPTYENARYSHCSVANGDDDYTITYTGYDGTCTEDSMSVNSNGSKFSTFDRDNDVYLDNCAVLYQGAWWYKTCHHSNLNGLYLGGSNNLFGMGMEWKGCWGHQYSVKTTVMSLRRM